MVSRNIRRVAVGAVVLAALSAVATVQPLDASVLVDAPPVVRAVASFAVVAACGGALLVRRDALVDTAVDDTMGRPSVAVVYGVGAFCFVLFVVFYANNVLLRLGLVETPLGAVAAVLLVCGLSLLGGLGYVVVGTLLTDLYGQRRPWRGLVVGGVISTVGWLVLPPPTAAAAWVLVAAVGVGGRTRTWFHGERAVASEGGS
jgi:hypothetical protein